MTAYAAEAKRVTKRYGSFTALEKVDITAAFSGKEYILWFEKQKNATMPEKYRPYIRQTGEGCRARIPEDESSQMIIEMIRCGWKLRGMRDAGI